MINERKMAFQYLCMKKSRSLATLFSIILSFFLVFVCSNLGISTLQSNKEEAIKRDGSYIACLTGVKAEDIPKIEEDGAVICAVRSTNWDVVTTDANQNTTFCLYYFEDFTDFPYHYEVVQGTIPDESGEIMLHEQWKSELGENVKPGDSITVYVENMNGDENQSNKELVKTYILSGFYQCPENSWLGEQNILLKEQLTNIQSTYNVYITSKEGGIETLKEEEEFDKMQNWARNLGMAYNAKVTFNPMFLDAYGVKTTLMYCLILLAAVLIGFFSVTVIRNAFVLSVVERTRDYGMLRCIGASKRQVRKIALYEAGILGIAGAGIGLVFSYIFLYVGIVIAKRYFSLAESFKITHHPVLILGTCFFIVVVVFFALLEPTRQINKLSPLNALRNRKEIKKEHFRAGGRMSRLIGMLFGTEGEYAYKNLLRNPKKFITITGSGMISIALFIGVNSIFTYVQEDSSYYNANICFDVVNIDLGANLENGIRDEESRQTESVSSTSNANLINDIKNVEKELKQINGVSNVTVTYSAAYRIDQNTLKWKNGDDVTGIHIISVRDEDVNKDSMVEVSTKSPDSIGCYLINWEYDAETGNWMEEYDAKPGDTIKLHHFMQWGKDAKEENISQIEVSALLKEHPIKYYYDKYIPVANIMLMPEKDYKELCLKQGVSEESYLMSMHIYLKMDMDCDVSQVKKIVKQYGLALEDNIEGERRLANQVKTVKVVVNVVLVLIGLIIAMNIFNSMQSNQVLREKERSILRTIGMSSKQYQKMMLLEGTLSTIISLVLGTIIGLGIGYGIYRIVLISSAELKYSVPLGSIVLSGVGLLLLTFVSSFGGMKKETKILS